MIRGFWTGSSTPRGNANRLVREELDENDTEDGEEGREGLNQADGEDGRYWARTSDPQLVEPLGVGGECRLLPLNGRDKRNRRGGLVLQAEPGGTV